MTAAPQIITFPKASGPGGPLQLAEGKGVKRVEAALGAPAEAGKLTEGWGGWGRSC